MLRGATPGAIILLHDGGGDRTQTLKALPLILKGLAKKHLISVTLPRLLNAAAARARRPASSGPESLPQRARIPRSRR